MKTAFRVLSSAILLSFSFAMSAHALDAPAVSIVDEGFGKIVLNVTAGQSGAPHGFTVWWMKQSDFVANGNEMLFVPSAIQGVASFRGIPTLNTWDGSLSTFVLAPNGTAKVEIGDLEDETGVWTNMPEELTPDTEYVFRVSANESEGIYKPASPYSEIVRTWTLGGQDCTYTQGFWKTHGPGDCIEGNNSNEWPVTSLTLGNVVYTDLELCDILHQQPQGNGLVSLAHQLIATKLNIANGADPTDIAAIVAAADAQIGDLVIPPHGDGFIHPSDTSANTQALDDYNNGITGPGHCPPTSVEEASWGSVKASYR
jgi:hypothetical protein